MATGEEKTPHFQRPDVQRGPWPGLRAAVLSKQETPGIYFYLVLSLLSLVSVENESAFHRLLSAQQIEAETVPRLRFLCAGLDPVLLCGDLGRLGLAGSRWFALEKTRGRQRRAPAPATDFCPLGSSLLPISRRQGSAPLLARHHLRG